MAVLAADADAEDQAPGGEPLDVGQLAGDQHRMAQRQQVEATVDLQRGVQLGQRRGLHEPVEARTGEEAHVIRAADMVEACVADQGEIGPGRGRIPVEQVDGREHAHPDGWGCHQFSL